MKKHWIHLFVAVIMVCGVLLACSQNSDKYDNEEGRRQLSELEKIMEAKFPPGSKIVYAESNERNKEAYSTFIVYSPSPAQFNRPPDIKTLSETPIEILKKASVIKNPGKLKNKWTYCYEGTVGKGDWSASQTNFETGSYLRVKQVFLYWQTN
jgi:hypothetical protein